MTNAREEFTTRSGKPLTEKQYHFREECAEHLLVASVIASAFATGLPALAGSAIAAHFAEQAMPEYGGVARAATFLLCAGAFTGAMFKFGEPVVRMLDRASRRALNLPPINGW